VSDQHRLKILDPAADARRRTQADLAAVTIWQRFDDRTDKRKAATMLRAERDMFRAYFECVAKELGL